jgi:hypothetical protein
MMPNDRQPRPRFKEILPWSSPSLRRVRRLSGVFLVALLLLAVGSTAARSYETKHVVLVIIDGLRYSDGLGDPEHKYVPKMHELSLHGAIVEPFLNDGYTYTARAIPAILCGAWTEVRTVSSSGCAGGEITYSELPTLFEYYRKDLSRPPEDCRYVLFGPTIPWKASLDASYGPKYWPVYDDVGTTDLEVWAEAKRVLAADHPSLLVLYLERVDHFAHTGSWAYYTRAIEMADSVVGLAWDFLESDPFYAGTTTMMVTNDHGRHTDDFTTHGDDCAGCRTIELLAIGPDIRPGLVSSVPRTLCDVTPTIGELLGFRPEKSTGQVMRELLSSE